MSSTSFSILVADGQMLTRVGIRELLLKYQDIHVDEASDHETLEYQLAAKSFDAIIIDPNTLCGFEIEELSTVHSQFPAMRIMVITNDRRRQSINAHMRVGLNAFLFKDATEEEVLPAIDALRTGGRYYCPEVFDVFVNRDFSPARGKDSHPTLTSRERDVLRLVIAGNSTSIIADQLSLSPHTISTHRKNIMRKLRIKSPVELVSRAYEIGLL